MKLVITFLACLMHVSLTWAACIGSDDSQMTGKFKIVEIEPARAKCSDASKAASYPGCVIKFQTVSRDKTKNSVVEKTVYSGNLLCKMKAGDVVDATLQAPCCDVLGLNTLCIDGQATVESSTDAGLIACSLSKWFVLGFAERDPKTKNVTLYSYGKGHDGFKIVGSKTEKDFDSDSENLRLAKEKLEGRFCTKLSVSNQRDYCLLQLSNILLKKMTSLKDVELCKSLSVGSISGRSLSMCLGISAGKFNDMNLCARYGLPKLGRDDLLSCFRSAKATLAKCSGITDTTARDACYTLFSICDHVTQKENKDYCWTFHSSETWKLVGTEHTAEACRSTDQRRFCLQGMLNSMAQEGKSVEAFEIAVGGPETPSERSELVEMIIGNSMGDKEAVAKVCSLIRSRKGLPVPYACR